MDWDRFSAADLDRHVGGRVRRRRQALGISQSALGRQLGLTFSQIQKYEKGANRIGAGRLFAMAQVLGVPISYFYEGYDEAALGEFPDQRNAVGREESLLSAYRAISNSGVRASFLALAEALAEECADQQ